MQFRIDRDFRPQGVPFRISSEKIMTICPAIIFPWHSRNDRSASVIGDMIAKSMVLERPANSVSDCWSAKPGQCRKTAVATAITGEEYL